MHPEFWRVCDHIKGRLWLSCIKLIVMVYIDVDLFIEFFHNFAINCCSLYYHKCISKRCSIFCRSNILLNYLLRVGVFRYAYNCFNSMQISCLRIIARQTFISNTYKLHSYLNIYFFLVIINILHSISSEDKK